MAKVIKEPGIRIPGDVLTGIFYKRPHKSLARFKSVEKEWNSLLSNYEFVNSYRTRKLERGHHHQLVFAKYYTARQIYLYTAEFNDDQELQGLELAPLKIPHQLLDNDTMQVRIPPEFLGSFNGLLGMLVVLRNGNTDFVLWNPLTSKYVTCSFHQRTSTVFDKDDDDYSKYKIICESLRGLCYDYSSRAYMAVVANNYRIFKPTGRVVETEIYIANFKTGEFTSLPSSALGEYASAQLNGGVGTVVCGVPHWVKVKYSDLRNIILYFDLEDKCFKHMAGPSAELEGDGYRRGSLVVGLGSLDGGRQLSIVLQETFDGEEQLNFEVWVMKEYKNLESWTKLFVIRDCDVLTQFIRSINVLRFMENGEWLISVNDTKVYAYDPEKGGLRYIQMEEYRGWFFSSIVANEPSFISDPTSAQSRVI